MDTRSSTLRMVAALFLVMLFPSAGFWRLRIYDAFYYDTGTFNHFSLTISAPEPASAILLTIGLCLTRLAVAPAKRVRLRRPRNSLKNV